MFSIANDKSRLHRVDASTGTLIQDIPLDRPGSYLGLAISKASVAVQVTDQGGLSDTQSLILSIDVPTPAPENHPPTITSTPVIAATVDQPYTYDVEATDPDVGDVLTYSLIGKPAGMSINTTTGLIEWTPTTAQIGSHDVTVRVQDQGGLFTEQSFVVTVIRGNRPPIITSTPITTHEVEACPSSVGSIWTPQAPMSMTRYAAGAAVLDGLLYAIGGCPSGGCGTAVTSTVEAYDPNTNTWIPKASLSIARSSLAASEINGHLYAVGGIISTSMTPGWATVANLEMYDPAIDQWIAKAAMPTPRAALMAGAIDGHLFVVGGHSAANTSTTLQTYNTLERYDPVTDQWTTKAAMPTARAYSGAGVIAGKLYVVGGLSAFRGLLATLEVYDPVTDTWTTKAAMPTARMAPGAAVIGGKLYVIGGSTASSLLPFQVFDTLEVYDPVTDTWATLSPLPTPRYGPGTGVINGRLYVAGGFASNPLALLEVLAPSAFPYVYDVEAEDPDGDSLTYRLAQSPAGMAIDSTSGVIRWNPLPEQVGNHEVTVQVEDSYGATADQHYTLTVTHNGHPPVIGSTPVTNARVGELFSYDVEATDSNTCDTLTFSLVAKPDGMTISATTGLIEWTPTAPQVGSHNVTVRVQDQGGLFAEQSFTVTVTALPTNHPPIITSTALTTTTVGQPYAYDVEATDPDAGDVLTYSLPTKPDGMTINATTGLIAWTPTAAQTGNHNVTVRVQDQGGLFTEQSFTVTVEQPGQTCTPPPPSMVGWWPGDGNANDILGGKNGTLQNGATFATGKVDQAFSLDGSDDYVDVPATFSVRGLQAFTVDAWINLKAVTGPRDTRYIYEEDEGTLALFPLQSRLQFYISGDGSLGGPDRLVLDMRPVDGTGNGRFAWVSKEPLAPDVWYHVVATWETDGATTITGRLYVNGTEVPLAASLPNVNTSPIPVPSISNTPPVNGINNIGAGPVDRIQRFGTAGWFSGSIDEVEIFNRALTAQEIQSIFAAGSAGKCKEGLKHPPIITSTPVSTATVSQLYTYDVNATDPDAGDVLTFSLSEKPDGMTINTTTGLIEWTPTAAQVGDHPVTVKVQDQGGLFAEQSFTVTVASIPGNPPVITSTPDISRWTQLTPTGTPPKAGNGEMVAPYDATTDRMIVFGHNNSIGQLPQMGSIWVLENATQQGGTPVWTQFTPAGTPPASRIYHAPVYDFTSNRVIFHGGCGGLCGPALADTWVVTNANGLGGPSEWVPLPSGSASAAHAAVYDAISNRMIVFGGHTAVQGGDRNDVRVLIDANGIGDPRWITLSPTGTLPPPRGHASAAYDAIHNRLIIFGGLTTTRQFFNDVWVLSNANGLGGTPQWTQLAPGGAPPALRGHAGVFYDPNANRLVLFGGFVDAGWTYLGDTWILTYANGEGGTPHWINLNALGSAPLPRSSPLVAYSSATNRMVTFGGRGDGATPGAPDDVLFNDTYLLTNANGQCTAGQPCNYDVDATDPDAGDTLTFSLDTTLAGMTIDPATGLIEWTPTPAQIGDHAVTVRVRDAGGLSATQTFTLTVAPVAVPNVVGLAPEWAKALIGAADLTVGTETHVGGEIKLNFDTLPSAQGWKFFEGSRFPEDQVFKVINGILQQFSV